MKVVALAGGTGSAKLLRGLKGTLARFTVIANTGDNLWMHGLYICPDLDTVMYTLAGVVDIERGWGIAGDTYQFLGELAKMGAETWFRLGDRDLATHVMRTHQLLGGKRLTEITATLAETMRVRQQILPPSDEQIETHIITGEGEMHLQDFWVKKRARGRVRGVRYRGVEEAKLTSEAKAAIQNSERILFCPGNPITSLVPMISVQPMRSLLAKSRARRVALSPMIGDGAFSGPAPKLMRSLGYEANSVGVAKLYEGLIDAMVIHESDASMVPAIKKLSIDCIPARTMMESFTDEERLADLLLEA